MKCGHWNWRGIGFWAFRSCKRCEPPKYLILETEDGQRHGYERRTRPIPPETGHPIAADARTVPVITNADLVRRWEYEGRFK